MNNSKFRYSPLRVWFPLSLAALVLPVFVHADDAAQPPQRLAGMTNQIFVKKAAELRVTAPKGAYVAVLDQSAAWNDPKISKAQDHNNGWLLLSVTQIEGATVKVKGKYYVPDTTKNRPDGIRMTLRQRLPSGGGLAILSDKTLKVASADINKWVDFAIELPVVAVTPQPDVQISLLLSATPLAGPIYLDMLEVTDKAGKPLWALPNFE